MTGKKIYDISLVLCQNDIIQNGGHEDCMSGNMEMVTPVTAGSVTTGSKAGLFRTPISGGVQSALAVNNLPHPALAVHNLMQQVMLTRNKIIGDSQIVFFFPAYFFMLFI